MLDIKLKALIHPLLLTPIGTSCLIAYVLVCVETTGLCYQAWQYCS